MIAHAQNSHLAWWSDLKTDYNAYKSSRFRRPRRGLAPEGSGADYHYRSENDFLKLIEIARDIDRNDMVVGQGVDRITSSIVQNGFTYDPQTGDPEVDAVLKARWQDWSEDATQCDAAGERTFAEMTSHVFRSVIVDGDIFGNPLTDGRLEMLEAHRCRSATRGRPAKNVVMGVEQTPSRKRVRFYFTTEDIDPWRSVLKRQLTPREAYDSDGNRNVFQVYLPKRFSQTRGISACAPIVDPASQHDDIAFAELVKKQVQSCWAIIRERDAGIQPPPTRAQQGAQRVESQLDGFSKVIEEITPGMEVVGKPGERLSGFSPNTPNSEYFPHMRMTLAYIAINLDMPLIMFLLDASETNFSGWRGAMEMAKTTWRQKQQRIIERWNCPVSKWQIRRWLEDDPALRSASRRLDIFRCRWQPPSWPYIQPLQDASADLLQVRNALNSHRRVQAARGRDWEEVALEHIEDNEYAIRNAATAAARLNDEFPELSVTWRELISLPTPDGVQINIGDNDQATAEPRPPEDNNGS